MPNIQQKIKLLLAVLAGNLLAVLMTAGVFSFQPPSQVQAQYTPMTAEQIIAESVEFFNKGADAYIMWQYSGDLNGTYFGNDQYSWFRDKNPDICFAFQSASTSGLVGVNVWELTKFPGAVPNTLDYLKNSCGIGIIRTFAYPGGAAGLEPILQHAQAIGMKVVVAIGDHANGGGGIPQGAGGEWYAGGYRTEYLPFAQDIINVARKYSSAIYAIELANEPHCGDDAGAVGAYKTWGIAIGSLIKGAGMPSAYGQFASHAASACDSPSLGSPSAFENTNGISAIDKTSGHYYDAEQKALNLQALQQSQSLGKPFYIGEAGWSGAATDSAALSSYYLYPIRGLNTGNKEEIAADLVNQGYDVQCTAPTIELQADLGGLFEYAPETGIPVPVGAELEVDFSKASVPVLRNENPTSQFGSLESFWGFHDPNPPVNSADKITSAPLYSLLAPPAQCSYQVSILKTIQKMCNKLKDPSTCALYKPIPGSTFDTETLLPEVEAYLSNFPNTNNGCSYLMGTNDNKLTDQEIELRTALHNTPLFLDKAYRLGFLVMAAQTKPSTPDRWFYFLLNGGADQQKHEVRTIAFKIPDFGTNKDFNSDIYYDDVLTITRNIHSSKESQDSYRAEETQNRQNLLTSVQNLSPTPDHAIRCAGADCGGPVSQALVDIINASGQNCSDVNKVPFEQSGRIKTSATITPSEDDPDGIYRDDAGTEYDPVLALEEQNISQKIDHEEDAENPDPKGFNFLSRVLISPTGEPGGKSQIDSYMITPLGSDLEEFEDVLIGQFLAPEQIERYRKAMENKKYFKLQDITYNFKSDRPQIQVAPPEGHPCYGIPEDELPLGNGPVPPASTEGCTAEAYLKLVNDRNLQPRILGGVLGGVTREIAKSVTVAGTKIYDFVSSCKTTEDFLLLSCTGSKPGTDKPGGAGDKSSECIEVWVDLADGQNYARDIAGNLPDQQYKSSTFAGWDAYFAGIAGTQYLFESHSSCGGRVCYDYILDNVLNVSNGGQVLNPYLAIAISLNETGGLKSVAPDASGRHFGCGVDPNRAGYISVQTIDRKLQCLMGFFRDNSGMSSDAALSKYGYRNGYQNGNLNKIISIVSNGNYAGSCK